MPKVTGKLTDFGYDAMTDSEPQLQFRFNTPGVSGASVLTTRPVTVIPEHNAYFEADLLASSAVMPAGFYTITIRYRERVTRQWVSETLPWQLAVPAAGGRIADLLRTSLNPSLAPGAEPPVPAEWWQAEMSTTFENAAQELTEAADARLAELSASVSGAITATQTPEMPNAVGEWWIHPIATYQDRPYPRTVFGAIAANGDVLACEFNHATGRTRRTICGRAVVDDHNVPSLMAEPGRRPLLSWTNHNADNVLRFKVGSVTGDLASLGAATEQLVPTGQDVSYSQIHFLPALSTAELSRYWVFTRTGFNNWTLIEIRITEATGQLNVGLQTTLIAGEGRQCYLSTADAHSGAEQVIRCGFGFNPAQDDSEIYYLEVNTATGEVTGLAGGATANVKTNVGLPIRTASLTPIVSAAAAGSDRRFFYVRPGPDVPALAYADWENSNPAGAVYKTTEIRRPDAYTGIIPGAGFARSAEIAAGRSARWAGGLRLEFDLKLPEVLGEVNVRIGTAALPIALFSIREDGTRRVKFRVDGPVTANIQGENISTSTPFAALAGRRVSVRMDLNITEKLCRQYYSTDAGATWTQIGTLGVSLPPSAVRISPAEPHERLVIQGSADTVDAVRLLSLPDLAPIVTLDARSWPGNQPTYTAPDGLEWETADGARSGSATTTRTVTAFGVSGPSIESYADAAAAARNYIAGMAFENPSYDGTVITAHSAGGVETVRKHRRAGSGYVAEILRQQPTAEGRLIRPYPPINGGPIPALLTEITDYQSFTNFEGNVLTT